jgi:putative transposase
LRSDDVLQCLTDLFVAHGPPQHIRSDNVLSDESMAAG